MFKTAIGSTAIAVFIGFASTQPLTKKTLEKTLENPKAPSEIRFELGKGGVVHPIHFIDFGKSDVLEKLQKTTKTKSEN
jgi:hypothetical protein